MRRLALTLVTLAALALPLAPARADFGLKSFDVLASAGVGSSEHQAGAHPFALATTVEVNSHLGEIGGKPVEVADGDLRDLIAAQMPGLAGNPDIVPACPGDKFYDSKRLCPASAQLGVAEGRIGSSAGGDGSTSLSFSSPIYSLTAPFGVAQRIGFAAADAVPVIIDLRLSPHAPYNVIASVTEISNAVSLLGSKVTLWGVPGDPQHDAERSCPSSEAVQGKCIVSHSTDPYLTLPRACEGPLATAYAVDSWQAPGTSLPSGDPDLSDSNWLTGSVLTHDESTPPNPLGFLGCAKLGFEPTVSAQPTSKAASSPSGLDFSLDVADEGLANSTGIAGSDIEKAVVTLPEGMSANPSLAEGLNVCTEAQLEAETAFSEAGAGCPNSSKIGTVEVETPLLEDKLLKGSLYIAKPYENPFFSLLALYIVIKDPELGISVKQPLRVEPDPVTGQLTTVAEELPQLPFSHFRLHFREGTRSPLVTPPGCGSYDVEAVLYPWSRGAPLTTTSAFQVITGPGEGPCPKGGLPPFKPGLIAGTINNRAGSFSPFNLRMFRSDSEQEITHFSIKLPPGITGKLAGIPYCPDAAIEAAKARTGPHGGQEELNSPSCPAASEIGRTLAGAGVGPALAYAPGKVYLAGPYHGSKLSMVAITAGVVGPFDIGTVVVREAFQINPETAEVFIDSTGSDPIPHIIRGIPVHLRDIRAYVDKPEFVLNPTDCTRTSTASTVLGSGLDFVSEADDNPITVTSPFQAADCAALPFGPQLSFRLIGGTRRGAHPKFSAHLAMNGIGEAGIQSAQVTLPRSEFIENAHFNTICTRVQFKEGAGNGAACPSGSIYGHAKAVTPILAEPLEGPVFLRSSEHQLPDLVVALHNSQVDFNLVGRVDSVKGQLRNTFETAPDAPVTSFDIELEGGKKGLFVNSTNLCKKKNRAIVNFTGQNGKTYSSKPALAVKCKKKVKGKARHKRHAGR